MNLPNKLTLSRLGLSAAFVVCFTLAFPFRFTAALAVFFLAVGTDYLDGVIARKQGLITDFGKLMDPLADKILTASAFICLTGMNVPGLPSFPEWAAIAIISREFLITGLRSLASSKGIVLPAERIGKHKTAWQMITILYFLILLACSERSQRVWVTSLWNGGLAILVPITVALTAYSGIAYLVKNWRLIETG